MLHLWWICIFATGQRFLLYHIKTFDTFSKRKGLFCVLLCVKFSAAWAWRNTRRLPVLLGAGTALPIGNHPKELKAAGVALARVQLRGVRWILWRVPVGLCGGIRQREKHHLNYSWQGHPCMTRWTDQLNRWLLRPLIVNMEETRVWYWCRTVLHPVRYVTRHQTLFTAHTTHTASAKILHAFTSVSIQTILSDTTQVSQSLLMPHSRHVCFC